MMKIPASCLSVIRVPKSIYANKATNKGVADTAALITGAELLFSNL